MIYEHLIAKKFRNYRSFLLVTTAGSLRLTMSLRVRRVGIVYA